MSYQYFKNYICLISKAKMPLCIYYHDTHILTPFRVYKTNKENILNFQNVNILKGISYV